MLLTYLNCTTPILCYRFCLHSCSVCKSLLPTDYCKFDKPVAMYVHVAITVFSYIYTDCHHASL